MLIAKSGDLGRVSAADLIDRTPLFDPSFPFVILWSQKAACTTLVKWFFYQIGLLEEALAYNPWIHEYENKVFKRGKKYKSELAQAINAGRPIYQFVRDPYSRAYSQYTITLLPLARTDPDHFAFQARESISNFLFGVNAPVDRAFSFAQFLSWLEHVDMEKLDLHFRPQRLPRDLKLNINVIKIESLSVELEKLTEKFGLRSMGEFASEILESGHHSKKQDQSSPEMLLDALERGFQLSANQRNRIPNVTQESIAESAIGERVRTLFEEDVRVYEYL